MASDFLLEIDGIKGESTDAKHKDTIEVESFSWGVSNGGSFAATTGGGAGKASFQDLSFTMKVNKASVPLFVAAATGQHIKKATLFVRKQGGDQLDYLVYTLEDLLVSSFSSGGVNASSGADIPTESVALNFAKISISYSPQKADGKLDAAVKGGWDLKKNAKV